MRSDLKIADSMLDLIGGIPLVRLNRIGKETGTEILVKPEFLNPSGTIKDRIAKWMIEEAEKDGRLKEGGEIIESTTGNTGSALAFVSAVKGYDFVAYVPDKVSNRSRLAIMQAYGCTIESVDTSEYITAHAGESGGAGDTSVHGAHIELIGREVCRDVEREQENVWWTRQFSNPQNKAAHRDWTAREILGMTDGSLDGFVASVGTGGTIFGIGQVLKDHDPGITVWSVEPAAWPMMGKREDFPVVPGISDGILLEIFDSELLDNVLYVSDSDAIDMAHQLAEKEGIFCGISSGANVLACVRLAEHMGPGKTIVTVLPDSRDRYLEVEQYTT